MMDDTEALLKILDRAPPGALLEVLAPIRELYELGVLRVPLDPKWLAMAADKLKASHCYYWHGGQKIAVKRVVTLAGFLAEHSGRRVTIMINGNPRKPPGYTDLLQYVRLGVHAGELQLWAVVLGSDTNLLS